MINKNVFITIRASLEWGQVRESDLANLVIY
jgi:hypothetical protein